jgi:hypothetical protein
MVSMKVSSSTLDCNGIHVTIILYASNSKTNKKKDFYLSGISSSTLRAPNASADTACIGGGGGGRVSCGGAWVHRAAASFVIILAIFDAGLSVPVVEHFNAVVFLFTGAVGRNCAATVLVCRFGHRGMKRTQAAAELPLALAQTLGFGACSGGPTTAATTAAVGE